MSEERDYSYNAFRGFIKPLKLKNKAEYCCEINEILDSMSYFLGQRQYIVESFLKEAIVLLHNSIYFFEKGFFDAAFYSLRESVELATTFLYFDNHSDDEISKTLAKWKNHESRFPDAGAMRKELENGGGIYSEFKIKMPKILERLLNFRRKINKYVHKQGYHCFYTYVFLKQDEEDKTNRITYVFDFFLKESIAIVASCRLMLDPLPILLLDEEIYFRLPGIMTLPLSKSFIKKYLGEDFIDKYKTISFYKEYEEGILTREKYSDVMFDFKESNYAPRNRIDEILKRVDLLSNQESLILRIIKNFNKIAHIHLYDGLLTYLTDKKGVEDLSFSSQEFAKLNKCDNKDNLPYKEGFITIIYLFQMPYYIETLECFNSEELSELRKIEEDAMDPNFPFTSSLYTQL